MGYVQGGVSTYKRTFSTVASVANVARVQPLVSTGNAWLDATQTTAKSIAAHGTTQTAKMSVPIATTVVAVASNALEVHARTRSVSAHRAK